MDRKALRAKSCVILVTFVMPSLSAARISHCHSQARWSLNKKEGRTKTTVASRLQFIPPSSDPTKKRYRVCG